jgi:hypothetical protein
LKVKGEIKKKSGNAGLHKGLFDGKQIAYSNEPAFAFIDPRPTTAPFDWWRGDRMGNLDCLR